MTTIKDAVKGASNWRDAVAEAIDHYTTRNLCFSSGEVAAALRTHRTDLRFSVLNLGEYVRDLFYNGEIKYTEDDGSQVQAVQVSRTTQGIGRTPAGQPVFVYGPDSADAMSHDFEVDIPRPGGQPMTSGPIKPKGGYPTAVAAGDDDDDDDDAAPGMTAGDTVGQKVASGEYEATVHTDKRLCITRPIFDKFITASGKALRGGDPVWIVIDDDEARITMDEPDDDRAKKYDLSTSRGRVLFHRMGNEFNPGDHYKVKVTTDALIVDLASPVD